MDNNHNELPPIIEELLDDKINKFSICYVDLDKSYEVIKDFPNLICEFRKFIEEAVLDNCYYLGRDEFLLIYEDNISITQKKIFHLQTKWLEKTNSTFSAGLVSYPVHGDESITLSRMLERGLYEAKSQGRNLVSIPSNETQVLKSNYYNRYQLERLKSVSQKLNMKESEILRVALDEFFRKYDEL